MKMIVGDKVNHQWNDWLHRFGGNIYHSPPWGETRRSANSRPLFFHLTDNDDHCLGIAVGIESWSSRRYIGRLSKHLEFETYPVVAGGSVELARDFIKQIVSYARDEGYRNLNIESFCVDTIVPDLESEGFKARKRIEFVVDLSIPEDELHAKFSSHHRRKMRKAESHGLTFGEAITIESIETLRTQMSMSYARRQKRAGKAESGGGFSNEESAIIVEMGKRYLENDLGRIFFMSHKEEIVSMAFVSIYANRALYVLGGSSDEGFAMNAPVLLFKNAFARCRELGCVQFNMGGVPASAAVSGAESHGLFRFKSGLASTQVPCLSVSINNLHTGKKWLIVAARKLLQTGR